MATRRQWLNDRRLGESKLRAEKERRRNAIRSGQASPGTYPTKAKARTAARKQGRDPDRVYFDAGIGRWRLG